MPPYHFLLCLLGLFTLCAQAAEPARLARFLTSDYPPYTDVTNRQRGAVVEVLRAALAPAGYQVEVDYVPAARLGLEKSHYEGVVLIWPQEAAPLGLIHYQPIFRSRLGFFTRRGSQLDVSSPAALAPRTVGITRGYGYPDSLLKSGLQLEATADDLSNLRKLAAGRFDLIVLEKATGLYLLRQQLVHQQTQIIWREPAITESPPGLALMPGRPLTDSLARDLPEGLRQLKRSTQLRQILEHYQVEAY